MSERRQRKSGTKATKPKKNRPAAQAARPRRAREEVMQGTVASVEPSAIDGPANKGQVFDFEPTEKQRTYLIHLLQGYITGGDVTDRYLAERVRVHATTISHWRDDPRFEAWVTAAFEKFIAGGLKKLLVRAMAIAAKGSVKHMEFFAKYSGQAPDGAEGAIDVDQSVTTNYTVISLVPRPPALPGASQ